MIRVFVGVSANGEDAESQAVLEYTLRKFSSEPIEIEWMRLSKDPSSFWYSNPAAGEGWVTETWATPFSGFRWAIPAFCNFEGKAIYMDSDMIINADIAQLWNTPIKSGAMLLQKPVPGRIDVCVWDCAAAKDHILPIERLRSLPNAHQRMMNLVSTSPNLIDFFDTAWNDFDGLDHKNLDDIKILHYTDMSSQPHLKHAIPRLKEAGLSHWFDGQVRTHDRQDIIDWFDRVFQEAKDAGYTIDKYIPDVLYGPYIKQSQQGYSAGNKK